MLVRACNLINTRQYFDLEWPRFWLLTIFYVTLSISMIWSVSKHDNPLFTSTALLSDSLSWIRCIILFLTHWGRDKMAANFLGVGGAVRFLVVGTIGQEERPPRGQLWMEQFLYARLKNGMYYAMAMSVRPSVRPSVRVFRTFRQHALRYQFEIWYIHSIGGTTCRVWVASQLGHFDLVYSQK